MRTPTDPTGWTVLGWAGGGCRCACLGAGRREARRRTAGRAALRVLRIHGNPPVPSVLVKLETQFGVDNNVPVGPAYEAVLAGRQERPDNPGCGAPQVLQCDKPSPARPVASTWRTQFGAEERWWLASAKSCACPRSRRHRLQGRRRRPVLQTVTSITGSARGVTPVALATTQFGTSQGVAVGTPARLCMPAGMTGCPVGQRAESLTASQVLQHCRPSRPARNGQSDRP